MRPAAAWAMLAVTRSGLALHKETPAADPMAPRFHFYPDFDGPATPTPQPAGLKANTWSQDISGPIAVEVNGTLHYHVFVDCIPPGSPCKYCPLGWATPLHWCHFSSQNLVSWQQHAVAIAPDRDFDGAIIDTGSVFQHPNGTVYAIYATSNATSQRGNASDPVGTFDGDICLARAKDSMLLDWEKLCDQPGGRIVNPTCHWCRLDCPLECTSQNRTHLPSPFPGILHYYAHRDPVAPWLDDCPPGGAPAGDSSKQCWYVLVGSGGLIRGKELSVATLFYTDVAMRQPWQYAWPQDTDMDHPFVTRDESSSKQQIFSCPGFFRISKDYHVFFSLLDTYMIGVYSNSSDGARGWPTFTPLGPRYKMDGGHVANLGGRLFNSMSIAKVGGVGPNNAMNASSRRLYFGTIGCITERGFGTFTTAKGKTKTGNIPSLPRDLSLLLLRSGRVADTNVTSTGGSASGGSSGGKQQPSPRLGFQFVPELAALRIAGSHRRLTGLPAGAQLPDCRHCEIIVEFESPPVEAAAPVAATAAPGEGGGGGGGRGGGRVSAYGLVLIDEAPRSPTLLPSEGEVEEKEEGTLLPYNCSHIAAGRPCVGYDRPGADLWAELNCTMTWEALAAKCEAMSACEAYTWVNKSSAPGLAANRCALKKEVPDTLLRQPGMICGVSTHAKRPFPPGASRLAPPSPPPGPPRPPAPPPSPKNAVTIAFDPMTSSVGGMPVELQPGEGIRCHVFVDGPYVESICNNQTNLFDYGNSRGSHSRLFGSQRARSVDIWHLRASADLRSDVTANMLQ